MTRNLSRFLIALTIGLGSFLLACLLILVILKFTVPAGVKVLGKFPEGYAIWAAVLFSLYVSAKLAARVWKADE